MQKREERATRHVREDLAAPPDLFGDDSEADDEKDFKSYEEVHMDDDARAKRIEREDTTREESLVPPDLFDIENEYEDDNEEDDDQKCDTHQSTSI